MTPNQVQADFETLMDYLKRSRGFDFSGYQPASLARRVQKRMQQVGVSRYPDYIDYLEVHPEEFTQLFNTILINLTSFFRDPAAWEYISQEVLPHILNNKKPGEAIRLWSAGCASGEEPYTLAILLAEQLGSTNFSDRIKIYATDVDEDALNTARQASYTEKQVEGVPQALRAKYFEQVGKYYTFHKELRRAVIFGQHDIIQDAPISRIDLLVCRNTLMYFNAETQSRVLARLHFAITDSGYLFLGRAEMLLTHTNIFNPADLKMRVFTRVPKIHLRDRLMVMAQTGTEDATNHLLNQIRLRDAAFDVTPIAQIVVDLKGTLIQTNDQARKMLGLNSRDVGKPFQDLQISYRPLEMRSYIDQAYAKRESIHIPEVNWPAPNGDERYVDVEIHSVSDNGNALMGAVICFSDITAHKKLQQDLSRTNQELETAMEELQSTNEELETTNEELQSTIEELETTNEELQSSNEELETMNDELHSSNEELEAINAEMHRRSDELNRLNAFLESILASLHGGVIVVDNDLRVQIWSRKAEDLWGLRPDEVHQENLLSLDIGLPVDQLKAPLRDMLAGKSDTCELFLEATNRRGRAIRCKIVLATLFDSTKQVRGAIINTEEAD